MRNPFKRSSRHAEAQARQYQLNSFQADLNSAELESDPGKKFQMLEQLQDRLGSHIRCTPSSIENRATGKFGSVTCSVIGGGIAATTALTMMLSMPPLILLYVPVFIGGVVAGNRSKEREQKRLTEDFEPFLAKLQTLQDKAAGMADAMLATDLDAIKKSGRFEGILREMPRDRMEKLVAAFGRQAAPPEQPAPQPQKKPSGGSLSL